MQNHEIASKFIKPIKYNKYSTGTIVGNNHLRNFVITFILCGITLVSLSIVVFLKFTDNTNELALTIFFSIIGLICFLFGLFFLSHRYVWKITITEDNLVIRTACGISHKYMKKDLFYKKTFNGFRVFCNIKTNKRFYFNENFTDHSKLIYALNK